MFLSTVIPTVGRPTLARAVASVASQSLSSVEYEIIVVNDSGNRLVFESWQKLPNVQIVETSRVERSIARNTGAAIAKGKYLHFLDDDDWLADDAFEHLWRTSQRNNEAAWIYGGSQLVDGDGNPIIQLHHQLVGNCFIQVMAGEWIPLQSSLIKADAFFHVGGFNPLITGPEDIDLLRRVSYLYDLDTTPEIVAYIVRDELNTTTDYDDHPRQSRWAREDTIDLPRAYHKMKSSASDDYWSGRIVRIYATSVVWNIVNRRAFKALSRLLHLFLSFLTTAQHIFSTSYWRAIRKSYQSITFTRAINQADSTARRSPPNSNS